MLLYQIGNEWNAPSEIAEHSKQIKTDESAHSDDERDPERKKLVKKLWQQSLTLNSRHKS